MSFKSQRNKGRCCQAATFINIFIAYQAIQMKPVYAGIRILCINYSIFLVFISCSFHSNSLKQENAEMAIKNVISSDTSGHFIIRSVDEVNIYAESKASVNAYVNYNSDSLGKNHKLRFLFERAPGNQWFLVSIESGDGITSPYIKTWIAVNKKLKIPVH